MLDLDDGDVEKVLDHYDIQYRSGRTEQRILCPHPDHEERNPSCSLNLSKGLFNCMACGFAGDAITLIREREGLGYAAALQFLQGITGGGDSSVRGRSQRDRGRAVPPGEGFRPRYRNSVPPRSRFGSS